MTVIFHQWHLGGDRNFTYLLADETSGEAAVVDPGFEPAEILSRTIALGLEIQHILITHGHADHTAGAADLAASCGAVVRAGAADQVDGAVALADGEVIMLGEKQIEALHTPGHSPGHFCYLYEGRLVTGDLLFCGKVGGTGDYFVGSSALEEYESLTRIMKLPEETLVYPGHDYFGGEGKMPHSSVGHEKANNPFLTGGSFESFVHLKENWATYKKEHGIR